MWMLRLECWCKSHRYEVAFMSYLSGLVHLNLQNVPVAESSVQIFYNTTELYIHYNSLHYEL